MPLEQQQQLGQEGENTPALQMPLPPPKLSIHPPLLNTACPGPPPRRTSPRCCPAPPRGPSPRGRVCWAGLRTMMRRVAAAARRGDSVAAAAAAAADEDGDVDGYGDDARQAEERPAAVGSVNSLGYSPVTLDGYLAILARLSGSLPAHTHRKTVIVSVTGIPPSVARCHERILLSAASSAIRFPLAMEVNLSCPNIPSAPPPAYSPPQLASFLAALPAPAATATAAAAAGTDTALQTRVPVGIKLPPLTYDTQFADLVHALRPFGRTLSFVTATNTLGSCLVFEDGGGRDASESDKDGNGAMLRGGMAGAPLHPLALGNVSTLRRLFDESDELRHLDIIGVGGVIDGDGYRRMKRAGAAVVGLATGLGSRGVAVFDAIERDINSQW
ncbi:hypothetical protein ACCO45_012934 [Purpureocillium lilacinum]|uniref:Uncharacterized protein n=1 Tax=Purpureocillium lilacinum TaxID=33203 RepID=A0ACC4DBZ2_PURLI